MKKLKKEITDEQVVLEIQRFASLLRGTIIHIFTTTEVLIDDIIRQTTFNSAAEYDSYMKVLHKGELTMSIKMELMKIYIEKYEKIHSQDIHSQDLTYFKEQIASVLDKRNILAHWIVDTTPEGVLLYRNKSVINFMKCKKNGQVVREQFDTDQAAKLETIIHFVTETLIEMQKTIYAELKTEASV